MTRENAKNEIRARWEDVLRQITGPAKRPVNGKTSYICPICGHGKGGDGLGLNPKAEDPFSLHCFGCGESGDIIHFYQRYTGKGFSEALEDLAGLLGITIDRFDGENAPERPRSRKTNRTSKEHEEAAKAAQSKAQSNNKPKEDYSAYYERCSAALADPAAVAYLTGRGISLETAKAFGLGYDRAKARIIIPNSSSSYAARSIDPNPKNRYMNPGGAETGRFNEAALDLAGEQVFVTEGAFDALAIIEAGAQAIALNGAGNVNRLLDRLEERPTKAILILCLDNDDAGRKAADELKDGLRRLNISYSEAQICGNCKDPAEAHLQDPEAFTRAIANAISRALKPDNTALYIDTLMQAEAARFRQDIKTGFSNLDRRAGGMYSGLYILAAPSSLGKTTFALQLADQIAAGGRDVIFFSLEQSRLELVSKSLARTVAQLEPLASVTSLTIRKGTADAGAVQRAASQYKATVFDRMNIVEGNFRCDIAYIGDYIRGYIKRTRERPVVMIDYLQILQPPQNDRRSTKEIIDNTVTDLKRISRELDLTILAISSINRINYTTPIAFESLKESGGIEYTADVIWGLQLQCMNEPLFSQEKQTKEKRERLNKARAETPRKIEFVCLKNRYGISNYSCFFDYYPAQDLFIEPGEPATRKRI